jgi:hypothetical protein
MHKNGLFGRVHFMKRLATAMGMGLVLAVNAVPALAGITPIPEPTTMGVFAAGAIGIYVVKRFIGRK